MTAPRTHDQRVHDISAELLAVETSLDRSRCAVADVGQLITSTLGVLTEAVGQSARSHDARSEERDRDLEDVAEHRRRLCSRAAELHLVGLSLADDLSVASVALERAGRVAEVLDEESGHELSGQLRTLIARLHAISELVEPLAHGVVGHAASIRLLCDSDSTGGGPAQDLHRPGLAIGRVDEDVRLLLDALALAFSSVRDAREITRDLASTGDAVELPEQRNGAAVVLPPTCRTWR